MTYAHVQDVLNRWIASSLPPSQETITAYLEDATDLIDSEFPTLAHRITTDTVLARRAKIVATRMVMRVLTNPDQLRTSMETTGPFSGSVTYAAETLNGLYLSDEDRALLSPEPARLPQAFSIDTTPGHNATDAHVLYGSQIMNMPE